MTKAQIDDLFCECDNCFKETQENINLTGEERNFLIGLLEETRNKFDVGEILDYSHIVKDLLDKLYL